MEKVVLLLLDWVNRTWRAILTHALLLVALGATSVGGMVFLHSLLILNGGTLHSTGVTWSTLCSSDRLLLLAPISRPACGVAMSVSTRALLSSASKQRPRLRLSTCKKSFVHNQSFDLNCISREALAGKMWSDFVIICCIVCDPEDGR